MNLTASLIGIEYFSLVLIPSSKIAVALHGMFLGNRLAAMVDNGERTNTSPTTNIEKPSFILLK